MRRLKINNAVGQGLTEYLILLVLIAVVSIGVTTTLGKTIKDKIQTARTRINSDVKFPDR